MKGMIIAGGLATRLRPLTNVTNKHLLPVYDKPMVYYPMMSMKKAGITEVLITTSPGHVGHFAHLLGSGKEWGMKLYYSIQDTPNGGIADAIKLGEEFTEGSSLLVILGDNIFSYDLSNDVKNFKFGARIFGVRLTEKFNQYGIIDVDQSGNVVSIEEKPENPKSDIAQTGIYMYDGALFTFINELSPSKRGELEVTDLNNMYLKEKALTCGMIDWWIDAGSSPDELLRASIEAKNRIQKGEL